MTQTLLVADYSALEVVILADLCKRLFGDSQLEEMVAPGAPDIHVENAKWVFGKWLGWKVPKHCLKDGRLVNCTYAGERVDAIPSAEFKEHPFGAILRGLIKTVWYGLQYGKGPYGFSVLEGPDGKPIGEKVAAEMLAGIEQAVPPIFKWQRWCRDFVDKYRGIYSLGGRWCPLYEETEPNAPDWLRNRAYRRAYNFPMQATGAEIIGDAMLRLARCIEWIASEYRVFLQVHDELASKGLLAKLEMAARAKKRAMQSATANGTSLLVPLQVTVEYGPNYYDTQKLKLAA